MNYIDKKGLSYLWKKIKEQLSNKVDKIDGKGLSTNDFTNTDKENLDYLMNELENLLSEV